MEMTTVYKKKKTTANVVFGQKRQLLFYEQRQFFSISPSSPFHDALAVPGVWMGTPGTDQHQPEKV